MRTLALSLTLTSIATAVRKALAPFSPADLFGPSDNGLWFDPEDMNTMFQDSAGTVPVTTVEQPIGKWLDKSGKGNHATQTTSTARPVLSARYNLAISTNSVPSYGKTNCGLSGSDDDLLLLPTAVYGRHFANLPVDGATGMGGSVFTIEAKIAGYSKIFVGEAAQTGFHVAVDLASPPASSGALRIQDVGDGWLCISLKVYDDLAFPGYGKWVFGVIPGGDPLAQWTPNGADGVRFRRPRIEKTSLSKTGSPSPFSTGFVPTKYQRVNTATDYDTVGFPKYVRADGIDDWMAHTFSAVGNMTLCAAFMSENTGTYRCGLLQASAPNTILSALIYSNSGGVNAWGTYASGADRSSGVSATFTKTVALNVSDGAAASQVLYSNGVQGPTFITPWPGDQYDRRALFKEILNSYMKGRAYGFFAINRKLTAEEIQKLSDYFASKMRPLA